MWQVWHFDIDIWVRVGGQWHTRADAIAFMRICEQLDGHPLYRDARQLYDEVIGAPRPVAADADAAMAELRRVFTDLADERTLLGA